eukprot:CAMPEP_0204192038 /NCGR_PEP_ID=MMETSP0361-20130328/60543_1 /ASSEMBLY_ACC=CAM_ASM_000343 /TAXON_ID=268821 /ORGANISM="Scrippsiella Hangoei, Strain SHTV-5" /LENGTH=61 /DNA_ID=CAMNT_0051153067 /DNA_START=14 /DNA_END=195 /DNA_ORIENTATION=+
MAAGRGVQAGQMHREAGSAPIGMHRCRAGPVQTEDLQPRARQHASALAERGRRAQHAPDRA